ncbi:MAG: peptidoglycan-binding domain-containing protein [Ilumatobacter sp.]|uniref:peptidoglycan-binding domain-containing protein n=1 Tax=Ilumatobacter sp. TaxID=1967498 RepID=UPI00260A052A|nr:peptidoglycan-binding domain-containing protein [Ilumatobacter sp.]MDJ0771512.1 peptidoglycan-binding domain-containing protein [Ilumatobacter sp.]
MVRDHARPTSEAALQHAEPVGHRASADVAPPAFLRTLPNSTVLALLGVQRDLEDAPAEAAPTLSNPRFSDDRILQRILRGDIDQLSARHNGRNRAVGRVQRALFDLGFDLPLHRLDGRFGDETTTAITEFRSVHGPSPGSILDAATLEVLDRVTPTTTDTRVEHTVDYARLLEDNRLDVTVAFGYSDRNALRRGASGEWEDTGTPVEEVLAERFRAWLQGRGFALELLGFDDNVEHWRAEHTFVWYDDEGSAHTRTADVWVRLLTPGAGAAAEFGRGLSQAEITLYKGHARYGSGPDFDPRDSSEENFRIGIDTALEAAGRRTRVEEARRHGVAVDEVNDLVELTSSPDFDRDRYRVLFLQACTSMAYLDELRSEVGGQEHLDVVGSRVPTIFTSDESAIRPEEAQIFLGGILDGETVEDIVRALDEHQATAHENVQRRGVFTMSGVGDNPVSER